MTATDRLRALLDARGVRWTACSKATIDNQTYCCGHTFTEFQGGLMVTDLTPEQAIDATLGRGTCEVEGFDDGIDEGMDGEWFVLAPATWFLSCGHEVYGSERPRYCPNCGRKVVE